MKAACLPASLAGLLLACAAPLPAALVFSEGFDYPQNAAVTGQGSWAQNATMGSGVVNAGLTYAGLASTAGGWQDNSNSLSLANQRTDLTVPSVADGSVFWFSFLFQQNSSSSSNAVIKFGGDTAFGNTNGIRFQIEGSVGNVNNNFSILGSMGGTQLRSAPNVVTVGQTFLLVGRAEFGAGSTERLTVWLNPALGTTPTTGSIIDITGANLGTLSQNLVVRSGGTNLAQWDEFRIGDSFADVTPVPEPAPLGTVALALLLMAARGWRRAQRPAIA